MDVISRDLQKAFAINSDPKLSKRPSRMRTGRFRGGPGCNEVVNKRQGQALFPAEKCKWWDPRGLGWFHFVTNDLEGEGSGETALSMETVPLG